MHFKALSASFLLGLTAAVVSGCPTTPACNASTCAAGCCDSTGRCQVPSTSFCGSSGAACTACRLDETCSVGRCQPGSSSVGGGSAGIGGGTSGVGGGSSGVGGGTIGGGPANAYATFVSELTSAYCAKVIECAGFSMGQTECAAVYGQYLVQSGSFSLRAVESVAAGSATFDSAAGARCLTQLRAATCVSGSPRGDTSACADLTSPAAAAGARCIDQRDCIDRTLGCNGAPCARTCTAGGALGESCRPTTPACDNPFVCIRGACRAEPSPGSPCTYDECGASMQCLNRVCERLPSVGQACPNFLCTPDAYCQTGRCAARKTDGTSCVSSSECGVTSFCRTVCTAQQAPGATCTSDNQCVSTASCFSGRCRTKGLAGAPCNLQFGNDCSTGLTCEDTTATCQPSTTVAAGQPCSSSKSCREFGNECRGKVATPPDGGMGRMGQCGLPMTGDSCTGHFSCGDERYCDMTSHTCQPAGQGTPCNVADHCRSTDFCTTASVCARRVATGQVCTQASRVCANDREACLETSTANELRCSVMPALGEVCVRSCQFPSACVNGRCVETGRVGQPCLPTGGGLCVTGACETADGGSTCVAARANNASCQRNTECQSGFCDVLGGNVCRAACN